MIEHAIRDYALAKRKAAQALGISEQRLLPSNQEIDEARREYLTLFHSGSQPQLLEQLRRSALEAMQLFGRFRPLLAGAVLEGGADAHTPIELHLHPDFPEAVEQLLLERKIPFRLRERRFRFADQSEAFLPTYSFLAGDHLIELICFPHHGHGNPPLSPRDGKRLLRASEEKVAQLLEAARDQA